MENFNRWITGLEYEEIEKPDTQRKARSFLEKQQPQSILRRISKNPKVYPMQRKIINSLLNGYQRIQKKNRVCHLLLTDFESSIK